MTVLRIYLWISAGFLAFGALAAVAQVGKPREPLTHMSAVLTVILTALVIAVMLASAAAL